MSSEHNPLPCRGLLSRFFHSCIVLVYYEVYIPSIRLLPHPIAGFCQRCVSILHRGATWLKLANQNASRNLRRVAERNGVSAEQMVDDYLEVQHQNFFQYQRAVANKKQSVRVVGREHLERLRDLKKGAILLSLHFGLFRSLQWQLSEMGFPVSLLRDTPPHYRKQLFGWLAERIEKCHRDDEKNLANDIVFFSDGLSYPKLVRRLNRGEFVLLKADGFMADEFCETSLFGDRICLPRSFAQLAKHSEVPIVPVLYFPGDKTECRIEIASPIYCEEDESVDCLFRRSIASLDQLAKSRPSAFLTYQHLQFRDDGLLVHVGAIKEQDVESK